MSSLSLKGKPSDQAPVVSANSGTPLTVMTSNSSSGMYFDYLLVLLIVSNFMEKLSSWLIHLASCP